MSLINDALKKAQKQRTGESPGLASLPSVGGESAARIAKRAKPVGFNSLLIRLGLGAGACLLLGAGGYYTIRAMRSGPATAPPAKIAGKEEAGPKPAEATGTTIVPGTAPTFVLPITVPPAPTKPVVAKAENKEPKIEPPKQTVATAAPPPAPVKPAPPAKLEPKAITYIENLRIAGIRASATDSKVLMNDRVYRVGDIIEHELGLKLTGITSSSLTFEDERGAMYMRQF